MIATETYYPLPESPDSWGRCSSDDDVQKKVIHIEDVRERSAEALATWWAVAWIGSTRRHFDREVIVLCVRWYLSYKLSSRDHVEMMSERGIALPHTTIWGVALSAFQKCKDRHAVYTPDFEL